MTVVNDDKGLYGTPVPKHNAMNEYIGSEGKFPCILNLNTIWQWSALNSSCFVHWESYLLSNGKREGNRTKMVIMTKTDILPLNINQNICLCMNDDSFVVYFQLSTKSMFRTDRISTKSKLDVT
jgi:hypothetical protein